MNLNSHQKEIIRRIKEGKIYDIYSFLESFDYLENYKLDADSLEKEFEMDEKDKEYKIPDMESDFENKIFESSLKKEKPDFTEKDFKFVKAIPFFDTPGYIVKFNDIEYKFSYMYKGITVAKDYSYILEFVTLWQQLQKRGLIFEVDKNITSDDIALFYEIFPTKETCYYQKLISDREETVSPIQEKFPKKYVRIPTYDCYEDLKEFGVSKEYFWNKGAKGNRIEKSLLPYYEKYPVFNELHLTTCKNFINKKIVATPMLREYVANNYQTEEEKKSKWALVGTWVAIGISFVMAAFSVFTTFNIDPSNNNLKNIQSQLEQISINVNSSNKEQLNEILIKLNEMDISKYDNVELQKELDSIIEILNEIKMSNGEDN